MRAIAETAALAATFRGPRTGLRVLTYHALGSPVLGDARGIFSAQPALFEAHMAALAQAVNAGDARVTGVSAQPSDDQRLQVAISFDDGYTDNLRVAIPILERQSFPCAVFAVSELVRSNTAPFLSPPQLRELAARPGVIIGAHGATHVALTQCDDRTLENELLSSKHSLEDMIGKPVTAMAYPFGAVDRRVRAAVARAGYALGFTSRFDINRPLRDPLLTARTTILGTDNVRVFRQKLHGDWDWYRWRNAAAANS